MIHLHLFGETIRMYGFSEPRMKRHWTRLKSRNDEDLESSDKMAPVLKAEPANIEQSESERVCPHAKIR